MFFILDAYSRVKQRECIRPYGTVWKRVIKGRKKTGNYVKKFIAHENRMRVTNITDMNISSDDTDDMSSTDEQDKPRQDKTN